MKLQRYNWAKMKGIKLSKPVWCCVIAIEVLLMCVCFLIYRNKESVELTFTQHDLLYESGESGFYLDRSYDHLYIATPEFTLPKGFYTIEAEYERSDNRLATAIEVQYAEEWYDSQYLDKTYNNALSGRIIPVEPNSTSCVFRVKYDDWPMQVRGYLTEEWEEIPYILIRNIRIVSSPGYYVKNALFCLAAIFFTVDLILLLYGNKNRFHPSDETKKHIKIIIFLIFTSSIPLMTDYLFKTHDLGFHLTRIEGLKEGLLNGTFPVRIQPGWLSGHGYATSVFYGDIFLYIPAVLRIFGVSVQASYKFYILLVNTATALIAYYCFKKMGNAKTGLVCTVVYTLNIYRLVCIYTRGAVGEYTAMVFLPLVLYGLWKIYMLPEESKGHKNSWITISGGCCGIFLSHILSTEMTAFFVILTAIVLWRKTFRKGTLVVLLKSAAATVLVTCWFLIPFMDYMLTDSFVINSPVSYQPYMLEDRSVFISQFFMVDFSILGGSHSFLDGAGEMPLTVGLAALSALAFWVFLCAGKRERGKAEKKTEYFAVFLCLLSLAMTTWLFPYTWLISKIPALSRSISSIQYPWRFFTAAGILLAYLVCVILKKEWIEASRKKLFIVLMLGLSFGQSLLYMGKCLNEYSPYRVYQAGNLSTYDVAGAEYFPENSSREGCVDELTLYSDAVAAADWHRDHGAVAVSLTNSGAEPAQVEVPLLLHKGYHAVTGEGEELAISQGASGRISVSVPAGFDGNFKVEFKEPWYWRMSELISLIALICLVLYPYIKNHMRKKQKPDRIYEI